MNGRNQTLINYSNVVTSAQVNHLFSLWTKTKDCVFGLSTMTKDCAFNNEYQHKQSKDEL